MTWHRPLLWLGFLMVALTAFCIVAAIVDPRQILGADLWFKPLKFAISTAIYSFTWAWLIPQLSRGRRLVWWAGTIVALLLVVELVIITGAAAADTTSHFNVSTPFATALWAVMAASISTVWVLTFVVCVMLFRNPLGDAARTLAIRAGAIIALVGMALAFLMTGPQGDQISNYKGIIGAHTVGLADGGPGLPVLGWSTVAGDLRIPHFVGMHALQLIPLALIVIEILARQVPRLRDVAVRARLVAIVTVTYAATLAVLTWQALRGQSIVQPDALTLAVASTIAALALAATVITLAKRPSAPLPVAA